MRFSKKLLDNTTVYQSFFKTFSFTMLNTLAIQSGFIKRKRKLRIADFIRLVVFWEGPESFPTLSELVGKLKKTTV